MHIYENQREFGCSRSSREQSSWVQELWLRLDSSKYFLKNWGDVSVLYGSNVISATRESIYLTILSSTYDEACGLSEDNRL